MRATTRTPPPPAPPQQPAPTPKGKGEKEAKKVTPRRVTYEELFTCGILDPVYRGLNIIPIRPYEKVPAIKWDEYQGKPYPGPYPLRHNLAVICGSTSGNLVVVDFDDVTKIPKTWEEIDTLIVRTPRGGCHFYFKCTEPIATTKLTAGVDVKGEGGYVLIPPSRVRREDGTVGEYTIIRNPGKIRMFFPRGEEPSLETLLREVNPQVKLAKDERRGVWRITLERPLPTETLIERVPLEEALEGEEEKAQAGEKREGAWRELAGEEIDRLVRLILPGYKEGDRQNLVFALAGWLAKEGISKESTLKVIETIATLAGDRGEEEMRRRRDAVEITYRKVGEGVDRHEILGYSGLRDVLTRTLGSEELALKTLVKASRVIKAQETPDPTLLFKAIDYRRKEYVVVDLRKLEVRRDVLTKKGLRPEKPVFIGAPTEVVFIKNPLDPRDLRFTVRWVVPAWVQATGEKVPQEELVFEEVTVEELLEMLHQNLCVVRPRLAEEVLPNVIDVFRVRGKAILRKDIARPGFYLLDGKVTAVRWDAGEVDKEKLKEALKLLNELVERWFSHAGDRCAKVIKWGVIAPFAFVYKQVGRPLKWMYLYGYTRTGKTTLGRIVLNMWGVPDAEHSGAQINTEARLGEILQRGTFPRLVNEPGDVFEKPSVSEMLKNAVESTVGRARVERLRYRLIPSYAPLIFTSNRYLPQDPAWWERLIILNFSAGEHISEERREAFNREVLPHLPILIEIGKAVVSIVTGGEYALGDYRWDAGELLKAVYVKAGLEVPAWVDTPLEGEAREEMEEERIERVRAKIIDYFNKLLGREEALPTGVERLINENKVPFIIQLTDEQNPTIAVTTAVLDVIGGEMSLKDLCELLNWEYRKITLREGAITSRKVAMVRLGDFIRFLTRG